MMKRLKNQLRNLWEKAVQFYEEHPVLFLAAFDIARVLALIAVGLFLAKRFAAYLHMLEKVGGIN